MYVLMPCHKNATTGTSFDSKITQNLPNAQQYPLPAQGNRTKTAV